MGRDAPGRVFRRVREAEAQGLAQDTVGVDDLERYDWARLRAAHARVMAEASPGPAAARYMAGWFGGLAASAIGYSAVATGGALFLAERGRVRWSLHPEGWTSRVDFGDATVLVPAGHAWAGQPGVRVVGSDSERARLAVDALVAVCEPIQAAINTLARGGLRGLWAEVGDGFGTAIMYQGRFPITAGGVAQLHQLARVPGAPWADDLPDAWLVEARHAAVCVVRKGGCCLAFTDTHFGEDGDHENDEDHRLYHQVFPAIPGKPDYCANCSFRPREECQAHQVWWREREHANRVAGA